MKPTKIMIPPEDELRKFIRYLRLSPDQQALDLLRAILVDVSTANLDKNHTMIPKYADLVN